MFCAQEKSDNGNKLQHTAMECVLTERPVITEMESSMPAVEINHSFLLPSLSAFVEPIHAMMRFQVAKPPLIAAVHT